MTDPIPPGWTLAEIARMSGGALNDPAFSKRRVVFSRIGLDTRALRPGDFFVALRGERHDAHDHLEAARAAGACGALVDRLLEVAPSEDRPPADPALPNAFPQVLTGDSLAGWQSWAAAHRAALEDAQVIGLTGSSGKTSAKDLLAHLLAGEGPVLATSGNRNNHIGVPWTLLGLSPDHRFAVIEMGMNHPGEIAILSKLAAPRAALITDIGTAHIGHLGSREAILAAKLEILEGLPPEAPLVVPHDRWVLERLSDTVRLRRPRTFGLDPRADWRPEGAIEWSLSGTRFAVRGEPVRIPILGLGGVLSALAALAAADAIGLPAERLIPRLSSAERRSLRMEPRRAGGVDWILDCYNASPESTRLAIGFLREVPWSGRRVLVLGELGELGAHSEEIHEELGRRAGAIETVLFVGDQARPAWRANREAALPSRTTDWVADAAEAAEWLRPRVRKGDLVLLKGARRVALESVLDRLYSDAAAGAGGQGTAPGRTDRDAGGAGGDAPEREGS